MNARLQEGSIDWQAIETQLPNLRAVAGGFSPAKRGLLTLADGQEVFVKIGTQDNTKKWAKKEVAVYQFLAKHHYPYAPQLLSAKQDETAFALEACTSAGGWDWQDNWSSDRLEATLEAIKRLASIELNENERSLFSVQTVSQDDNGWLPLLESLPKQEILKKKLQMIGAGDTATSLDFSASAKRSESYHFETNTLVHYDLRADNCAWNATEKNVAVVDWNWAQLGDARIDLAATLTNIQKSGYDLPSHLIRQLDADALHWLAGMWFNSAASPIWEGGSEHLRDFQLEAGLTAYRLSRRVL